MTGSSVIDVASWLREASVAGLITGEGDRLAFRHDLVRDAVYDHMLPAERRDLHRAAAQALAREEPRRNRSLASSPRGPARRCAAAEWLVRAADETVSTAPSATIALYDEALAIAPEMWHGRGGPAQARMIEPLAWCGHFAGAEQVANAVLDAAPAGDLEYAASEGFRPCTAIGAISRRRLRPSNE